MVCKLTASGQAIREKHQGSMTREKDTYEKVGGGQLGGLEEAGALKGNSL